MFFYTMCASKRGQKLRDSCLCTKRQIYSVYTFCTSTAVPSPFRVTHCISLIYFLLSSALPMNIFYFYFIALFNIFRSKNTKINTLQLLLLFKYRKNLDFVCGIWHIFRSFLQLWSKKFQNKSKTFSFLNIIVMYFFMMFLIMTQD